MVAKLTVSIRTSSGGYRELCLCPAMDTSPPSRLYPDSRPSPALSQPPGMVTPVQPVQRAATSTPPSPQLDLRLPRMTNDCAQYFAAVEQVVNAEIQNQMQGQANAFQAGQGVWMAISHAFHALNVQTDTWAQYLQQYASIIDSHHASFHKAKKAIANLHGLQHDLEVSAALKFSALDRDVGELRQAFQQGDIGSRVVVDQLATDIRTKVAEIEASFAQGRWVELIGREVDKHAGAFTLLAGQASVVDRHVEGQGWVIKELKDEMKEVKDVVTVAVGHIQELETAERSRNLSRATQPLSSDRLVGGGIQQFEPLQSRILSGATQSMSQDRLVGNGGETAPESPSEEPWDPWRRPAQAPAPAPVQRGFSEHGSQEDHRSRFSEKVAVMATYQYDGDKGGAPWRLMIRQYLISRPLQ